MPPAPGSPCPPFSATAAVSGRVIDNKSLAGHTSVLVLHGPRTMGAPKEVAKAVRGRSMSATDPILVNVVDLRSMAGLWRKVAEAQIKTTYNSLAGKLPPGEDPVAHIAICPDWDGSIVKALGVDEPDKGAAAVVLGPDGKVKGVAQGPGMAEQVLGWLA